jgi:putative Mg2+ transporter-C (MgtC) family protein
VDAPQITDLELALRLLLALILCGVIGLERESRGQVAGLRTHVLVGVGAALFTLISAYGFSGFVETNPAGGYVVTVDPTRIAAQVVAGIGFLGAGAIITQGMTVRGLTTAAALWIAAAVGMAAGAGYYFGAVAATICVLVALIGFRHARGYFIYKIQADLIFLDVELETPERMGKLFSTIAKHGAAVEAMDPEGAGYRLELMVPSIVDSGGLETAITKLPGVRLKAFRGARADELG